MAAGYDRARRSPRHARRHLRRSAACLCALSYGSAAGAAVFPFATLDVAALITADDAVAGAGEARQENGRVPPTLPQDIRPAIPPPSAVSSPTAPPLMTPPLVPRGLVDLDAPLLVNERLVGEIGVRVDTAGNGDIDAVRLLALLGASVDPALFAKLKARIGPALRTRFDALDVPPIHVDYDPATLEVAVSVPASALALQSLSMRGDVRPDPSRYMQQARLAGGVGLAIDQGFIDSGPDRGRSPLRVTADGFVTFGAFPGVTLRSGGVLAEHDGGHYGFDRSVTRLTYDDFDSAIRYAAGELTPRITGFQGSNLILGIAVARDYQGIRPFENIRPSGRGGVTLDRPSTIIVETNGVETRRLRLDPGRYQLTDLSSQFGANDVRLIVEDDLGRHEVASAAFFTATAMLAGGLTDFGAALGRQENGERRYGGPMTATGYIRHGFANRFTLGTGGQYADGNWQVSGEGVVGTPIGLFRGQASTSRFDGKQGTAFSIDWLQTLTLDRDTWNFTVLSSRYSKDFSSPFDRDGRINDERWHVDARADWRRGNYGLAAIASYGSTRSNTGRQGLDLNGYLTRGRFVWTATLGVERNLPGGWHPQGLLGLSMRTGRRNTIAARVDTRQNTGVIEASRSPIDQVGDLSGRIQLGRSDERAGVSGDARYFGNRFIASIEQDLQYSRSPTGIGARETRLRASTFLGFADGKVSIGRPGVGNFAIFDRHATLDGAAVTIKDEAGYVVGRQDWLGAPLVPLNRVFSPILDIYDVDPLPAGYDLGDGQLLAFPGSASGYRVAVGSAASRIAMGFIVTASGPVSSYSGVIEKIGDQAFGKRPIFTNDAGRFAADHLSPGRYRVTIETVATVEFAVSELSKGIVDVGTLHAVRP